MVDGFSYINSKDIREYLRSLNYQFEPKELAWLIWQNRSVPIDKKIEDWMEIGLDMPDCKLSGEGAELVKGSLRELACACCLVIGNVESSFYNVEGNYVYAYRCLRAGENNWSECFSSVYTSLQACEEALHKKMKEGDVVRYQLRRQNLEDPERYILLTYIQDDVLEDMQKYPITDLEDYVLHHAFQDMWIQFPTPFHKGDIVTWDATSNRSEQFVLESLCTDEASDYLEERGSLHDMYARGYFVEADGVVRQKTVGCYMDLERVDCTGDCYEPEGSIEREIAMYLQGRSGLDFLLSVYRDLMLKRLTCKVPLSQWFEKELLIEVGAQLRNPEW